MKRANLVHFLVLPLFALLFSNPAMAGHAFALGYEPKYKPGFDHFDYVNPNAPKGGDVVMSSLGNFDSLNPFVLRAVPAVGLTELVFESLTEGSLDEPITVYGLLADDMELAPDKLSVTFHLNPKARFSDGSPVTAEDVKYSFETLTGKLAHPQFAFYWADIRRAVILDRLTVRFEFKRRNAELHIIAGQMPIFSRKWGAGKPFNQIVTDAPIASGPYLVDQYDLGKRITYRRNPNYWGKDLNTRRGIFNFDRVTFRYYKDGAVRLEAFKAGEFDFIEENSAKLWAKNYVGEKFDQGRIRKTELRHRNNAGIQGFVFNTRRPLFQDKRVRKAINLAFDFEWSNRHLFYGQYTRNHSYFSNSEMAAKGLPQGDEAALLDQFRSRLPGEIFTTEWRPPDTDPPRSLRANLLEARRLLEEAGWHISDNTLVNAKGEPFTFEMLVYDKAFERIFAPFERNLEKLGIKASSHIVDLALFQRRKDRFEFDMMIDGFGGSQNPGNELTTRFSSKSADEEGSDNAIGVKDPVVDALIQKILAYRERSEMLTDAHALDRVLLEGEYLVPNWYIPYHRVAYQDKFEFPKTLPLYYGAADWMLKTWWKKGR